MYPLFSLCKYVLCTGCCYVQGLVVQRHQPHSPHLPANLIIPLSQEKPSCCRSSPSEANTGSTEKEKQKTRDASVNIESQKRGKQDDESAASCGRSLHITVHHRDHPQSRKEARTSRVNKTTKGNHNRNARRSHDPRHSRGSGD